MKYVFAMIAVLGLSACLDSGGSTGGGSGGGDVDLTPDAPSATMNAEMGTLLNGARGAGLPDLTYNSGVGAVVQDHANDMYLRDYLSIYELGSTDGTAPDGRRDMGDDLNDANLRWDNIIQMVSDGDNVAGVFSEFRVRPRDSGIEGNFSQDLNLVLEFDEFYEFFAIAKAGPESDQKWALLVVQPQAYWSER